MEYDKRIRKAMLDAYNNGFSLDDAWAHFGTPEKREKLFRLRANVPFLETELTTEAKACLALKLRNGELVAIYLLNETLSGDLNLEFVPREKCLQHLFRWSANELKDGRKIYRSIRIGAPGFDAISESQPNYVPILEAMHPNIKSNINAPRKEMGRPKVGPYILKVLDGLLEGPGSKFNASTSVKERESALGVACRDAYPSVFPRPTTPSREKVREALRARGLLASPPLD